MKPIFIISVWVIFFIINICLAEWNVSIRNRRIKAGNTDQIEHFWWTAGYLVLVGIIFYISRNYWELFSLLLLRLSVFSVSYNVFARLPTFNLSKTSKSFTDRMMVKIGFKSTEEVNVAAFCISLVFLMLQLFKL